MQARKKEMTQEEINLIKEIGQIRKAKNKGICKRNA